MSKTNGRYQINEKDIEGTIKYLKIFDPEHATPEMAVELLEYMQATYHTMIHEDPDKLEKIFKEMLEKKKLKTN